MARSKRSLELTGCLLAALAMGVAVAAQAQAPKQAAKGAQAWVQSFTAAPADLATTGENPYFILTPGYQLVLEGKESGAAIRLVVSVLDETKRIGGYDTRVVEERETSNGVLVEVSRNYFAIHKATRDVFYFGEEVDVYKNGKIVDHEGAWLHGTGGAKFGMMMPGKPQAGLRYYQEVAPKVAMDRAEIVKVDDKLTTPAGSFDRCVRVEETTPLESDKGLKVYAPGIGLLKDGVLELVSYKRK